MATQKCWFGFMMVVQVAMAKDPEAYFFKKLEGLLPCEVSELKAGTHIFAVYGLNCKFCIFILAYSLVGILCLYFCWHVEVYSGDNFFKTASYTIEALCTKTYEDTTEKLKDIEAQILRKRSELRDFEVEYRKVLYCIFKCGLSEITDNWNCNLQALARFQEVTNKYSEEKQSVCCQETIVTFYLASAWKHAMD